MEEETATTKRQCCGDSMAVAYFTKRQEYHDAEKDRFKHKITSLKEKVREAEKKSEELQRLNDTGTAKLAEAQTKQTRVDHQLAVATTANANFDTRNKALEVEIFKLRNENAVLRDALSKKRDACKDLELARAKMTELVASNRTFSDENGRLRAYYRARHDVLVFYFTHKGPRMSPAIMMDISWVVGFHGTEMLDDTHHVEVRVMDGYAGTPGSIAHAYNALAPEGEKIKLINPIMVHRGPMSTLRGLINDRIREALGKRNGSYYYWVSHNFLAPPNVVQAVATQVQGNHVVVPVVAVQDTAVVVVQGE